MEHQTIGHVAEAVEDVVRGLPPHPAPSAVHARRGTLQSDWCALCAFVQAKSDQSKGDLDRALALRAQRVLGGAGVVRVLGRKAHRRRLQTSP